MLLTLEERTAIRYYVLRAFVFYSKLLLRTLEQKKMPRSFEGYHLTEWKAFTASDDYHNLLDKFHQEAMKGELDLE
jgi:hypothetical protein